MHKTASDKDEKTRKLFADYGMTVKEYWKNAIRGRDEGSTTYNDRIPGFRRRVGERIYLKYIDPKPGELILDAGCGTGWYSKKILEKGAKVVASDVSGACLQVCRENAAEYARNLLVVVADAQHLPFKPGVFDKVLIAEVCQHIPLAENRRRVFRGLASFIKENGLVVMSIYNLNLIRRLRKDKEKIVHKSFYHYRYSCSELRDELKEYFSGAIKIFPIMHVAPFAQKMGKVGVLLDTLVSYIPFISYLRGHLLLALAKK